MRVVALATGGIEKIGAAVYEKLVRPSACRWPEWIERCVSQGMGAVAALEEEPWTHEGRLDQARITTACLVRYVKMTSPELMPRGRFPQLEALSASCEARPEFQATFPADYAVPRRA